MMNMNMNMLPKVSLPASLQSMTPYLKDPWVVVWVVSGLLTMLIPLISWNVNRSEYYTNYGSYIYAEDYYKQQQEAAENYYNDDANNGNGNNGGNYYTYYKECSWYNWASCRKQQYMYATMEDRANGDQVQEYPGWYFLFGGNPEELERWEEENTGNKAEENANANANSAGMTFVYIMTLGLFLTFLTYGTMSFAKRHLVGNGLGYLLKFLSLIAIVAVSNAILAVQTMINQDEKDMEDSYYGWYGQVGVLLAYTYFWIVIFCVGFMIAIVSKHFWDMRNGNTDKVDETTHTSNIGNMKDGEAQSDYVAPADVQMA
mmetsp:Transcript_21236/g.32260  ORF Transcript_21236/g.32260 Transcript_21236/m.32260 type:complete len:316 (-) Transcript_21236:181-1128(-)|eukprot:CAMPEP_0194094094 /NCGR_PEP_ID=MMETSP0149-20130528/52655_1 /TAXON_ID=122233 /ORGANISM="Chaetoceros debilis, Strain MM31A-1" /LENGTH=315 /DNA_ID=CAMNT_0038779621 /DNA_START=86 /DNA_END=1033 /DNA_ORIENTATION=+